MKTKKTVKIVQIDNLQKFHSAKISFVHAWYSKCACERNNACSALADLLSHKSHCLEPLLQCFSEFEFRNVTLTNIQIVLHVLGGTYVCTVNSRCSIESEST